MLVRWRKLFNKSGLWLATEIWLNFIGLDNFADYSEYIFAQDLERQKKNHQTVKINNFPPQFCPKIDEYCPVPGAAIKLSDLQQNSSDRQGETVSNRPRTTLMKENERKLQIFADKCQKIDRSCIKVLCLKHNSTSSPIIQFDDD